MRAQNKKKTKNKTKLIRYNYSHWNDVELPSSETHTCHGARRIPSSPENNRKSTQSAALAPTHGVRQAPTGRAAISTVSDMKKLVRRWRAANHSGKLFPVKHGVGRGGLGGEKVATHNTSCHAYDEFHSKNYCTKQHTKQNSTAECIKHSE